MTDMVTQAARWCASNVHFATTINGYEVTYARYNPGPYQVNWSCKCKGFQFRKTCKHITEAEQTRHCGYGWEASAGSPIEMGNECPKCGGPTEAMSYAV